MTRPDPGVERAREALARCDWQAAYGELARTTGIASRDPDALDALAEAAWWLGRHDESRAAREQAYAGFEAAGDRRRAARMAAWLYDEYMHLGRSAVAGGWARRVRRMVEGESTCAEQGLLAYIEADRAHARGDLDAACERAEEVVEVGRKYGDADLEATGLQALGHILMVKGSVADSSALFDEAMLLAMEGRLSAYTTGVVYCSAISACEAIGDLGRAAEWTDVGARWAEDHPLAVYPGICRVHRAGVLSRRGAWPEAEQEARRASAELADVEPSAAADAFHEIGEIRLRLGDLPGAEAALRRAEELGAAAQPGLALLRLAQGKVDRAASAINRAVSEESRDRLRRAKLLPAQVQIALAARDQATARGAADELDAIADEYGSSGLRAAASLARGRVQLAEAEAAASATLRRALRQWQELDVPYEVATTRLLMGMACREAGDEDGTALCFEAASAIFGQLGAALDAARTEALRRGAVQLPAGLTEREAEVLRLVASGLTTKDIAEELHLSVKTVARHLSNIFVKIGVSSRSAATAYAFEHRIAGRT